MAKRIIRLLIGLVLFGAGCGLMVRAGWGVDPWTVLAEGLSVHTGIGVGWIANILGAIVLLAWIPLRQRPGIGTVANVLLVGSSMQATLAVVPTSATPVLSAALLALGIATVAFASGMYITTGFGPGPRDGLMTGLNARLGWPIWVCRLLVESTVLVLGWLLGGTVGIGTLVFAVAIGPLVHHAMRLFQPRRKGESAEVDLVSVSAPDTPGARHPA